MRLFEEVMRLPKGADLLVGRMLGYPARVPNELNVDLVVLKLK